MYIIINIYYIVCIYLIINYLQSVIIYINNNNIFKYTANTFTKFIPNYNNILNNPPNNNYEIQIKNLKEELVKEKNKNKLLENENIKLNNIINDYKNKNNDLNNQIKTLNLELNKLKLDIQNNNISNNNISNNNLNDLVMPLLPGEKIISVIFFSHGFQDICNWSLPCKNTNLFIRLEEILNNTFPLLKKHETYFVVNTKRIKRFQTLDENNIKNNDIINIFLIDDA